MRSVDAVRDLLPAGMKVDTGSILELIKVFANTWVSLDAYDKQVFGKGKTTKKKVVVAADELAQALQTLRAELMKKNEASGLFANERNSGALEGIIGAVMQAFGGKDLYPSVEEKAAHLLYFMVKNHPFTDGNKRSGAFAFVWFLRKTRLLDMKRMTPEALTALTLLIAESDPKDKPKMTALVVLLLRK
jgi:prophage maintenance system killer protein